MAFGMFTAPFLWSLLIFLTLFQDIAPTYYDIGSFPKGDIRSALTRAADRLARKEKMRAEKHR